MCHLDWNVPALVNQNDKYTNPNSSTANVCTWCVLRLSVPITANVNPDLISSWLAYNLLSACSDCQGVPQAVQKYVCN